MSAGQCFQCGEGAEWEFVAVLLVDDDGERHAAVRLRGYEGDEDAVPVCALCVEAACAAALLEARAVAFRRTDGALGYASRAMRWVIHPEALGAVVARVAVGDRERMMLRELAADRAELRWSPQLSVGRRVVILGRLAASAWAQGRRLLGGRP